MGVRDRPFPLLYGGSAPRKEGEPRGIPWELAQKAYSEYVARYGHGQSLERLAERGGFGPEEMDELYSSWRDEL